MNFTTNSPIYLQIAEDIKRQIISGAIKEGEKLPSVRDYCQIYEVTGLTMQRAMAKLEAEGVTYAQKGVGSFVCTGIAAALAKRESGAMVKAFTEKMCEMGYSSEEIISAVKEELEHEHNS